MSEITYLRDPRGTPITTCPVLLFEEPIRESLLYESCFELLWPLGLNLKAYPVLKPKFHDFLQKHDNLMNADPLLALQLHVDLGSILTENKV